MRLDKYLCECSGITRSEAKKKIKQGLVKVNDALAKDGAYKVDASRDNVLMDGVHLSYQEYIYYVFHKPKGCVCANYDALHDTVFSYVPMNPKEDLFTVGRLDMDTEGLLLITNDGEFSHNLLSPKKHVDKTYFALWDKPATEEDIKAFESGLDIGDDKPTKPAKLSFDKSNPTNVFITISEGRFHQVKRMSHAVGKEVLYLKRLSMGQFILEDNLALGEYREFTDKEMKYVKEYKGRHL